MKNDYVQNLKKKSILLENKQKEIKKNENIKEDFQIEQEDLKINSQMRQELQKMVIEVVSNSILYTIEPEELEKGYQNISNIDEEDIEEPDFEPPMEPDCEPPMEPELINNEEEKDESIHKIESISEPQLSFIEKMKKYFEILKEFDLDANDIDEVKEKKIEIIKLSKNPINNSIYIIFSVRRTRKR